MQMQQQVARIPGVGNTQIFGQRQYAMRIWLDPVRMTGLGIASSDVIAGIQNENIQAAAGQIGQPPNTGNQQQQLTILAPGRYSDPKEFGNIVVRGLALDVYGQIGLVLLIGLSAKNAILIV